MRFEQLHNLVGAFKVGPKIVQIGVAVAVFFARYFGGRHLFHQYGRAAHHLLGRKPDHPQRSGVLGRHRERQIGGLHVGGRDLHGASARLVMEENAPRGVVASIEIDDFPPVAAQPAPVARAA